jgi:hypothetical protein
VKNETAMCEFNHRGLSYGNEYKPVCPLLVFCHHFGDFGLSDGVQMVSENNGVFVVFFVFFGNFCISKKNLFKLLKFKVEI